MKKNFKETVVKKKKPITIYKLQKEINLIKKNTEKKIFGLDSTIAQVNGATGQISSAYNGLVQGNGLLNREAMVITPVSLRIPFLTNQITVSGVQGFGCLDIVLDRRPTGTLPTVDTVFNGFSPKDLPLYGNRKRFKILRHIIWSYDLGTLDSKGYHGDVYITFKNLRTTFTGNAGTQADFTNGQNDILIIWRSTNTSVGNLSYGVDFDSRVTFTDS